MIAIALRIVVLAAAVTLIVVVVRWASQPDYKCRTCRHCRKLFHDGARCGYGDREVFKNSVHITNCRDYELNQQ